jgi:hypothetical protein
MRFSVVRLRTTRVLRPLIGVVLAYAVAAQALLVAIGGFPVAAQAHDGVAGFELCLHDSRDAQHPPANIPDRSGCTHCLFCFAGAHHAVIGAPQVVFHRIDVEGVATPWLPDITSQPPTPAHSIANPRGPPLRV